MKKEIKDIVQRWQTGLSSQEAMFEIEKISNEKYKKMDSTTNADTIPVRLLQYKTSRKRLR